jgi:hypothetical protein
MIMSCGCGVKMNVYGEGMLKTMHDLLSAKRELEGDEKFITNMQAQEAFRQTLDQAATNAFTEEKKDVSNACN